ncbi:MAG: outer membrane lipid asymmetry maintenance protein MlaD [Hahellaceae bacterium]|jgi:phospholipid/cholesterol/gamma-HCH transport system substrate-binding protein|nr:outer membrane lipid asymmetry maintenance protein MlaD [Hahellaceae bacterium]MCP5211225.1 outer membrane lipid asymmetry maintenance protein MlaD [Hahellaceae bacterium]
MYSRWIELLVGIFMLAGVGALLVLALQVSGLTLAKGGDSYTIYAQFDDLGGLSVRGKVAMAGVTIGKVSAIELDKKTFSAKVSLTIDSDVDFLSIDSTAAINTAGLLGEKYVSISMGADEQSLKPGDVIYDTQSALNIEKLIGNFATGK